MFWSDILRGLFFSLDKIIYGLVKSVYELFIQLTNVTVLSVDTTNKFAQRIYLIVGFVMLFKLSFSLIKWFANPESVSDNQGGAGKVVTNIIISLIMLVSVPTVFNIAYRIQSIVVEENVLGELILGADKENSDTAADYYRNGGDTIATSIFKGFFRPADLNETDGDNDEWVSIKSMNDFNSDMATEKKEGDKDSYAYDYSYLISTIAGLFTLWVTLSFCFDVAVRSVKLIFLQLLAPVPILSYIDPKSKKTFDSWLSSCIKTYMGVLIFFIVFVISEMTAGKGILTLYKPGTNDKASDLGLFATAFIIMGLLLFVKKASEFIEEAFGLKGEKFELNPLKKAKSVPGLTRGTSALGAGAAAAIGGFAHGGFRGLATGLYHGLKNGWKEGKDNPIAGMKSGAQAAMRKEYARSKTSFWGRHLSAIQSPLGIRTEADQMQEDINDAQAVYDQEETLKKTAATFKIQKNEKGESLNWMKHNVNLQKKYAAVIDKLQGTKFIEQDDDDRKNGRPSSVDFSQVMEQYKSASGLLNQIYNNANDGPKAMYDMLADLEKSGNVDAESMIAIHDLADEVRDTLISGNAVGDGGVKIKNDVLEAQKENYERKLADVISNTNTVNHSNGRLTDYEVRDDGKVYNKKTNERVIESGFSNIKNVAYASSDAARVMDQSAKAERARANKKYNETK